MSTDRPQQTTPPPAPAAARAGDRGRHGTDTARAPGQISVDQIRQHWQADVDRHRAKLRAAAAIAVIAVLACALLALALVQRAGITTCTSPTARPAAGPGTVGAGVR